MRDPNLEDVHLILRLYELRREKEMRKARTFIIGFTPKTVDELLAAIAPSHPESRHFAQVTSYWEMVADFVLRELLHPEMFVAHCGEALVIYARMALHIDEMRKRGFVRFQANMTACVAKYPQVAEKLSLVQQMLAARERMIATAEQAGARAAATKKPAKKPARKKR